MLRKAFKYLNKNIWEIKIADKSAFSGFYIKQLRKTVLATKGFIEDKCLLRASGLAFYSVLSVVPIMALIFGIAKGFGFEQILTKMLLEKFQGQEDLLLGVIRASNVVLENTKKELITGIGLAILFWAVIRVLGNIESAFNEVWGTKRARPWGRKLIDYFFLVLVFPILFIMSSSVTVIVASRITHLISEIIFLKPLMPVVLPSLEILPYGVIWILFTFMYIFLPNTKVKLFSGIIAGITAGTLFQIVQWLYIILQIKIARYNAVYGSITIVPFLLIWLQIGWAIVLFGAEVSYANQHIDDEEINAIGLKISYNFKKLLVLKIMHLIVYSFDQGRTITAEQISESLVLPVRLTRKLLYELVECNLISEINGKMDLEFFYQPARSTDSYTIMYILDSLHKFGDTFSLPDSPSLVKITKSLESFEHALQKSRFNLKIKDI